MSHLHLNKTHFISGSHIEISSLNIFFTSNHLNIVANGNAVIYIYKKTIFHYKSPNFCTDRTKCGTEANIVTVYNLSKRCTSFSDREIFFHHLGEKLVIFLLNLESYKHKKKRILLSPHEH